MLSWLAANGGTIGVAVLLLLVTGSIIAGLVHNRKKGKILLWLQLRKLSHEWQLPP